MSVWKQVTQQVGNLAKHVAKQVIKEPMEVVENAVGENQAMEAVEQATPSAAQTGGQGMQGDGSNPKGFKTVQDFQKYQQLSGKKDKMEMAVLRKRLHQEYGLQTDLEGGMQRARMEYEQKEEQRKQVEEQKKEEKKQMDFMQKKQEDDMAVKAATESANPEKQAWGAG